MACHEQLQSLPGPREVSQKPELLPQSLQGGSSAKDPEEAAKLAAAEEVGGGPDGAAAVAAARAAAAGLASQSGGLARLGGLQAQIEALRNYVLLPLQVTSISHQYSSCSDSFEGLLPNLSSLG